MAGEEWEADEAFALMDEENAEVFFRGFSSSRGDEIFLGDDVPVKVAENLQRLLAETSQKFEEYESALREFNNARDAL